MHEQFVDETVEVGGKFAEPAEEASVYTMKQVHQAIKARERPPERFNGPLTEDDLICTRCEDEDLPEARRRLGYTICLTCAEREERRKSMMG